MQIGQELAQGLIMLQNVLHAIYLYLSSSQNNPNLCPNFLFPNPYPKNSHNNLKTTLASFDLA